MKKLQTAALACAASAFALAASAAGFTPGNVILYRIGIGSTAPTVPPVLSGTGNPVFLDEYTPAGVLVQSVAMPTVTDGANKALVASGTATTDGHLTRSADGSCLAVPGYARDLNTGSGNVAGTGLLANGSAIPRAVAAVSATGAINSSTALTDIAVGGNLRGAASVDCGGFWVSGASGGMRYAALGATTSTDLSSTTFANLRVAGIANGQLYVSVSVGGLRGVATVGTGLPISGAQTLTKLNGLTDTNSPGTYGFFFADLDGTPGVDTLYVADDLAGALTKFSLVAGTWTSNGTIGSDVNDYRALTGVQNGNSVTLFATRATSGGQLVTLVDASGYNGPFAGTPTVLATVAPEQAYRGVAMAPYLVVTPSAGANGTISPNTAQVVGGGATAVFTVTPSSGYTALVGGTCGGNLVGNTYTTNPVTASCTVDATFTLQQTYTVTPSAGANGTIDPDTPQVVLAGATKQFTVTPGSGYAAAVDGTCGGNLAGNTYTTNAVNQDCTVQASFSLVTYAVTPSAGANGSINPNTTQFVPQGQGTTFTVTADLGYSASVGGTCGGTLTGTNYVTNAITADCTVEASFTPLPTYTVTPSAGAHGTITPDTPQVVTQGQAAQFTVTADSGYTAVVRGTCGGTLSGTTYTTNAITANCTVAATFTTKLVLFVGNSYTFGRVDPVMSYNTANVTDLTHAMWLANATGSNPDEPHPWGGIPGVFKKFLDQAGLDWDVSISARNAASLRGHYLNSNPAGWDLRGNVASQKFDVVVLQDLSDEPLPANRGANANLAYFNAYADKLLNWAQFGAAETYTESQLFGGSTAACQAATGASAAACDTVRVISPANANANPATSVYLYQTWARPDMIAPNGTNVNGHFYTAAEGLEAMTADLHDAYFGRNAAEPRYKAVNPVGDAFLRAVTEGFAMRDPYVPEPNKINLWHTDYFHPSKHGSYLSALVHFAMITGIDPTTLGASELAAADLGISAQDATDLQLVARLAVSPQPPTNVTATGGNAQVTVSFIVPLNIGGLPIIDYTATCGTRSATGTGSPIFVTGLPNAIPVACTVVARNSVGTGSASAASNSATPGTGAPPARGDFNADGRADILFQNTDGRVAIWLMDGFALSSGAEIIGAATGWSVVRIADFDNNGTADLVWQHTDGRVAIYLMNGLVPSATQQVLNAGPWTVVHAPDLDGDGKADLVFRNADGSAAAWLMNGTTMASGAGIMGPGTGWRVTKTGDFDGDGKADLVWTHTDGRVAVWLMEGLLAKSTNRIENAGSGWSVIHTADFNGDGRADIVWQHTDGRMAVWLMNGAALASGGELLGASTGWAVTHASDFDGDGKSDLFFEHADGRAAIYLMNGLAVTAASQILNAGGGWSAKGLVDLDGDGKADIVWVNVDGSTAVWLMNGTTVMSGTTLLGPGTNWEPIDRR